MPLIREPEMGKAECCGKPGLNEKPVFSAFETGFFNFAYFMFSAVYAPVFFKKIKQAADPKLLLEQRKGRFSEVLLRKLSSGPNLWLHAVSVGEVMAMRGFIQKLLNELPEAHLVLTTVTPTGQKIAKEMESSRVTVMYFPFDYSWVCRRFFEAVKPKALLLAETEVWPNLLIQAQKHQVPAGILNARLSERSSGRYKTFSWIFKKLFQSLDFVLAQTEQDAARFREQGIAAEKVQAFGNMKFDEVPAGEQDAALTDRIKKEWGFRENDKILIAGSTHAPEENLILQSFSVLKKECPELKLILAPRHIERGSEIRSLAESFRLSAVLATESKSSFEVLVLNQLGVLKHLYAVADLVFVGGSFVQRGGQNPIEPASCRKAVVHGPHVFNFKQIYRELDQEGVAREVENQAQLTQVLQEWLRNPAEVSSRGEKAFQKVRSLQGSTRRHLDWISGFLKPRL